jgi:hypothetical protein
VQLPRRAFIAPGDRGRDVAGGQHRAAGGELRRSLRRRAARGGQQQQSASAARAHARAGYPRNRAAIADGAAILRAR